MPTDADAALPRRRHREISLGEQKRTSGFSLKEVVGRDLDRIWLRDGRFVHGIKLPHLLKDFPVKDFMLIQSGKLRHRTASRLKKGFYFGR